MIDNNLGSRTDETEDERTERTEKDLKVCDDGTLVQILRVCTLSIVLSLSKNGPIYFSKHSVSETGFCLRLLVKPTQLGQIDRASPYLRA
jgi:hypothetical protein